MWKRRIKAFKSNRKELVIGKLGLMKVIGVAFMETAYMETLRCH